MLRAELDDPSFDGWNDVAMHNFERYLYQRDEPGATTVAVEPVGRSEAGSEGHLDDPPWGDGWPFDYTARRTDRSHGSDRIVFDVEDRFMGGQPQNVLLKVTWRDDGANWYAEYDAGETIATETIHGSGSGEWVTSTFALSGATFAGGVAGRDLAIVASSGDVTVKLVRLIKWPQPDTVTYGDSCALDDTGSSSGKNGKCGCGSGTGAGAWWFLVAVAAAGRRRLVA